MPGDATHVKSAKFVAAIGAVILYTCGMDLVWVVATVVTFMFGVMYLSPDLDLPRVGPVQRWGALKIGWAPFEKIIPHRSRWSHGWILGLITIQLNFFIILAILILFLRVCWLPLIEPMITQGNAVIDDLIRLHFSKEVISFGVWWFSVAAAYHWHHKILDTFMRN